MFFPENELFKPISKIIAANGKEDLMCITKLKTVVTIKWSDKHCKIPQLLYEEWRNYAFELPPH